MEITIYCCAQKGLQFPPCPPSESNRTKSCTPGFAGCFIKIKPHRNAPGWSTKRTRCLAFNCHHTGPPRARGPGCRHYHFWRGRRRTPRWPSRWWQRNVLWDAQTRTLLGRKVRGGGGDLQNSQVRISQRRTSLPLLPFCLEVDSVPLVIKKKTLRSKFPRLLTLKKKKARQATMRSIVCPTGTVAIKKKS